MLPTTVLLVCDASVPNSKRWMLRDLESAVDVRDAIGYTVADCVERVTALQEATIHGPSPPWMDPCVHAVGATIDRIPTERQHLSRSAGRRAGPPPPEAPGGRQFGMK